jgi:Leucine Rich repeats (2 copies)
MLNPDWWKNLEPLWKQAFAITLFKHPDEPTQEDLALVYNAPALRFAGPEAPFPNMSFEVTNLTGVSQLPNLEILVVTHHKIISIKELETLQRLKSLFLFNNQIKSLEGIEALENLEQLYVQCNQIESIRPIEKLTNLKEVYVNSNRLSSLEGLTEQHADKLTNFFCKPNDLLKQKEIIRVERELGILCR